MVRMAATWARQGDAAPAVPFLRAVPPLCPVLTGPGLPPRAPSCLAYCETLGSATPIVVFMRAASTSASALLGSWAMRTS